MNLHLLAWLQTARGQQALAETSALELSDTSLLRDVELLRRQHGPEHARVLAEQVRLRRKAVAKFPEAARMFFSAEALEQASGAAIAAYRARRFPQNALAVDLGCGLGGDTLALARRGAVVAVDRDPLRCALVEANARALGLAAQVQIVLRDLLAEAPPPAEAYFADPARRKEGRRLFDPRAYQPPLDHICAWRGAARLLAIKLAPGLDPSVLPPGAELEFISRDGELKEAVAWYSLDELVPRRATLLHGPQAQLHQLAGDPSNLKPAPLRAAPQAYLYDPDPAVVRAGLVALLAEQVGAGQLDPQIAYLTAERLVPTPFARAWPILEWLPWNLKRLRRCLAALDVGPVTVKKRGSPLDADQLAHQLRGQGARPLVVTLTRLHNQPIAIICAEPLAATASPCPDLARLTQS
jgi:hypothetical protein